MVMITGQSAPRRSRQHCRANRRGLCLAAGADWQIEWIENAHLTKYCEQRSRVTCCLPVKHETYQEINDLVQPFDDAMARSILATLKEAVMDTAIAILLERARKIAGMDPEQVYQQVYTDTRAVQPGDLFVALHGERFNGNAFASSALARALAAVVDEPMDAAPVLRVADARVAYGGLAAAHQWEFDCPVFGVAGSNGKILDMLASVLGVERNVLRSEASFNNDGRAGDLATAGGA